VSVDEFCDEMVQLSTSQLPMEAIRLMKQASLIRSSVVGISGGQRDMMKMIYTVHQSVEDLKASTKQGGQTAPRPRASQPAFQTTAAGGQPKALSFAVSEAAQPAAEPAVHGLCCVSTDPVEKRVATVEQMLVIMDQRLAEMDQRMDQRLVEIDENMDRRFNEINESLRMFTSVQPPLQRAVQEDVQPGVQFAPDKKQPVQSVFV